MNEERPMCSVVTALVMIIPSTILAALMEEVCCVVNVIRRIWEHLLAFAQ